MFESTVCYISSFPDKVSLLSLTILGPGLGNVCWTFIIFSQKITPGPNQCRSSTICLFADILKSFLWLVFFLIFYISSNLWRPHHQTSWDFHSRWSYKEHWSGDRWHMTHGFNFLVLMLISARVKRLRASRLQKNSFFPLEIVTFPFLPPAWAKTASCCQLIPLVIPLNPQLAPRHSSPAQTLPNNSYPLQ